MFVVVHPDGRMRARDGQWTTALHEAQICDTRGHALREAAKYHDEENIQVKEVVLQDVAPANPPARR